MNHMADTHTTPAATGMAPAPTFSGRLVQSRRWLGLHQDDLATRIGVSRRTVSSWEHGDTVPSVEQLLEWAKATGFSPGWFVDGLEAAVTDGSLPLNGWQSPPLVGAAVVHWN